MKEGLLDAGPSVVGMDDRIRDHARTLVDWSARVEEGDHVVIETGPEAHDLAHALVGEIGERGATYHISYTTGEVQQEYLTRGTGEIHEATHERSLYEHADVLFRIGGDRNQSDLANVPSHRRQAYARSQESVREARLNTRWISTAHPTPSLAQAAGMSTPAYRKFAYEAILRDWETLATEMATLKTKIDEGDVINIVTEGTDLECVITDRTAVNSAASIVYDSHNLPSGEVFTAPAQTRGHITFDIPMTIRGQSVRQLRLDIEDNVVTDCSAVEGEAVVNEIIQTDDGASRVGELGIGMNRAIDRYTNNILFDEKMGGTIHLALGRAYEACLPGNERGNQSAVHVDFLCDMKGSSRMRIDGELIQRNGWFQWEPEFSDN